MDDQQGRLGMSEDRPMPADTQSETLPRRPVENGEAQRGEWIAAVERIISEAEAWATEQQWFVHRDRKTLTEDPIGSYEVPVLMIRAPAGRLVLEPTARYVGGVTGRIDFSAFPSYAYVLVVRTDAGWYFVIDPPTLDRPWSKEAFLEIATELAGKA
jgi:hypothetical protein